MRILLPSRNQLPTSRNVSFTPTFQTRHLDPSPSIPRSILSPSRNQVPTSRSVSFTPIFQTRHLDPSPSTPRSILSPSRNRLQDTKRTYAELGRMPAHLIDIPTNEHPTFFDAMVYNYHKARLVVESRLLSLLQPTWAPTVPREAREERAKAIMSAMEVPESAIELAFAVRMDDGSRAMRKGFAVHYRSHNLPVVVPLRLGMDMTRGKVTALAHLMTYKCGIARIPFGGGSAGLVMDFKKFSSSETQRTVRQFASELIIKGFIGPNIGIISPDKGVKPSVMKYILALYRRTYGYSDVHASTLVTGRKPLKWLEMSTVAAGFFACLEYLLGKEGLMKSHDLTPTFENKTYVTQGCGRLALQVAAVLETKGCKLIGVQTTGASIINPNGIDIKALTEYRLKHGNLVGFPGAEPYKGENVLFEPCDFVILAATQLLINAEIANKMNTKMVAELANAPITPSGDRVFVKKNVLVVPDILANSGGLVVSYIEWLQKISPINNILLRYKRVSDYDTLRSVEESLRRQAYKVEIKPKKEIERRAEGAKFGEMEWFGLVGMVEETCERVLQTADSFNLGPDLRTAAHIGAILHIYAEMSNRI